MQQTVVANLKNQWKLAMTAPGHAFGFLLRRAIPFGIRFKDLEAYRISTWSHGRLPRMALLEILPGIENVGITMVNLYRRKKGLSMDAGEVMVLCAIEKFLGARKVLEIGTYDGNTTVNLAANLSDGGCVATIDLPPDWDGRFVYNVPATARNVTEGNGVGVQYRQSPYKSRVRQVLGDSAALDWRQLDPPFDLIFVDGCHYYDYVKKDTENAFQFLRSGGVVVWHDYGDLKDVSRAVDETARTATVYAVRGTRLAIGWRGSGPQPAS
jgi:predicted O-methyltransferase YrrM